MTSSKALLAGESIAPPPIENFLPSKVTPTHRERLAIVYVRQSSPQQMEQHKESLERQYALQNLARTFGWHSERILVIDEDLGLSGRRAEDRNGFQRLMAEVTMEHAGMVLALEMSRLARSCKDWHHLLDLCGIFNTLLADQDGVYDPADPNDRLLLGLKGTISEVELHTMRNRLEHGKLNKAQRGELFLHAPVGYVKAADGKLALDPDEQVREAIHLLFDKYIDLGSIHATFRYLREHDIKLGIRPTSGPNRGQLEWRTPSLGLVSAILRNPTYAGAYTYGRFPVDRKRQHAGAKRAIRFAPMEEWQVLLQNKFPGYISWEQYLENRERARQNRTTMTTRGSARGGGALLVGLVYCAQCGARMIVRYSPDHHPRYECHGHVLRAVGQTCGGLNAAALDQLVEREVLRAVEPSAIELSLRAVADLQHERERLDRYWHQKLERARYESQKAQRAYRAVDPENRLVARTLEQDWEAALRSERNLVDEYERFQRESLRSLTSEETIIVRSLASNLPEVWNAPSTQACDKQEVVRCLVERIDIRIRNGSECVETSITWVGGSVTRHETRRPVQQYQQLESFVQLRDSIRTWRDLGMTNAQIAARLNEAGFHPVAARAKQFTRGLVAQLVCRLGLAAPRDGHGILQPNEWWLRGLADELGVPSSRVRQWLKKGHVCGRKLPGGQYVVWADEVELARLAEFRDSPQPSRPVPETLRSAAQQATAPDIKLQDSNCTTEKPRRRPK